MTVFLRTFVAERTPFRRNSERLFEPISTNVRLRVVLFQNFKALISLFILIFNQLRNILLREGGAARGLEARRRPVRIAATRLLLLLLAALALGTLTLFPTVILKLLHCGMPVVFSTIIFFFFSTGSYVSFIEGRNSRTLDDVLQLEFKHFDEVPDQMHVSWLQTVHRVLQNKRGKPLRRHPPLRIIHAFSSQQCNEGRVNPVPQQCGFLEGNVELF